MTTTPDIAPAVAAVRDAMTDLDANFIGRTAEIRLLTVALVANGNALLYGDPGTAKSRLAESFGAVFGFDRRANDGASRFYRKQLTKFSTPEELFGPVSVNGIKSDDYRRVTDRTLADCGLAFIDEIFKSNDALLNALLGVLEERVYVNGTNTIDLPLEMVVSASNELPKPGGPLRAVYDRFTLRREVHPLTNPDDQRRLARLKLRGGPRPSARVDMAHVRTLRAARDLVDVPDDVIDTVIAARDALRAEHGINVSDRAFCASFDLVRASAVLDGRMTANAADVLVLVDSWWQRPEDRATVNAVLLPRVSPDMLAAAEIRDAAVEAFGAVDVSDVNVRVLSATRRELVRMVGKFDDLDTSMPAIAEMRDEVAAMRDEIVRAASAALGL